MPCVPGAFVCGIQALPLVVGVCRVYVHQRVYCLPLSCFLQFQCVFAEGVYFHSSPVGVVIVDMKLEYGDTVYGSVSALHPNWIEVAYNLWLPVVYDPQVGGIFFVGACLIYCVCVCVCVCVCGVCTTLG